MPPSRGSKPRSTDTESSTSSQDETTDVSQAKLPDETIAEFRANSQEIPIEPTALQPELHSRLAGINDASKLAKLGSKFEIWAESIHLDTRIHNEIPGDLEILHGLVKASFNHPRWLFDEVSILRLSG